MSRMDAGTGTFDDVVASNMRALRHAAAVSQAELAAGMTAKGTPMNRQTITKTEAGKRSLRFEEAITAAAVLGVPLTALVEGHTTPVGSSRSTSWAVDTIELEQRIERMQQQIEQLTALVEQPALV